MSKRLDPVEKILWSLALPGFGQILNGKNMKGVLFIALEFLINVQANFNVVILLSFHGDIQGAVEQTNYQWLMFYPCLYLFAAWDAYRDTGGEKSPYSFLPFVMAAYFVTVGLIYSPSFRIMGILMGPVWLPMLCCFIGIAVGLLVQSLLRKWKGDCRG
jgi:TM2 domain-containing membrane protein YozV